jgi:hypothetical protein
MFTQSPFSSEPKGLEERRGRGARRRERSQEEGKVGREERVGNLKRK